MFNFAIPPINGVSSYSVVPQDALEREVAAPLVEEASTQADLHQVMQTAQLIEQKLTRLKELVIDLGLDDFFLQDELVSFELLREPMQCYFSTKVKQLEKELEGLGVDDPLIKFADLISQCTAEFKFYPLFSGDVSQIIQSLSSTSRNHFKSAEETKVQLNQLTQAVSSAVDNHLRLVKVETYLKCQLFLQYCVSLDSTPTTKDFTDEMRIALKIQIANALKLAGFVGKSDIDESTLDSILTYAEQSNSLVDSEIQAQIDEKIIELKKIFHERGYIYRADFTWRGYQKSKDVESSTRRSTLKIGCKKLPESLVSNEIQQVFEIYLTTCSEKIINGEFNILLDNSWGNAAILAKAELETYRNFNDAVVKSSVADYTIIESFFYGFLSKILKDQLLGSDPQKVEEYQQKLKELVSEIVSIYQLIYDKSGKDEIVHGIKAVYKRLENEEEISHEEMQLLNRITHRLIEQFQAVSPSLAATLEQNLAALKANFVMGLQYLFVRKSESKTLAKAQAFLQQQEDKVKKLAPGTVDYDRIVQQIDELGKSIREAEACSGFKPTRVHSLEKILTATTEFYPEITRDIDENFKIKSLGMSQNPELKLWANIYEKQFKMAPNLQIKIDQASQVKQLALKEGEETALEPLSYQIKDLIEEGIGEMRAIGYFKLSAATVNLPFPPHIIVPVKAVQRFRLDLFEKFSESRLASLVVQVYQMISQALLKEYAEELQGIEGILPLQEILKIISSRNQVKDYQRQMAAIDLTVDYAQQMQALQGCLKQVDEKEASYNKEIEVLNKAKAIVVKALNNSKINETAKAGLQVKLSDLEKKIEQAQREFQESLNVIKGVLNGLGVDLEGESILALKVSVNSKLKLLAKELDRCKQYDILDGKLKVAQEELAHIIEENLERQPDLSTDRFNEVIDDYEDLHKQIHMRAAVGAFKLMGLSDFEIFNIR